MPDEIVTRQCGVSSVAAHRGIVTCLRSFVEKANRMRFCALLFLTFYYTWCAASGIAPEDVTNDATADYFFALLYADAPNAPHTLRQAAQAFRENVLEGFALPKRSGAMARVAQSFRVNIQTAVSNLNKGHAKLLTSYLMTAYSLGFKEAKLIAQKLGATQSEVLDSARKEYRRVLDKQLDEVELQLQNDLPDVAVAYLKERRDMLKQRLRDVSTLTFDDASLLFAFDRLHPYPKYIDEDFLTGLQDVWQAEFAALPLNNSNATEMAMHRMRRILICNAAHDAGGKSCAFSFGPAPSYACDMVPMDKKTVFLFLKELQDGAYGSKLDLRTWLTNHPRHDEWGLFIAFDEKKLRRLHTAKYAIDGQILTDGVRVIFPMRTHEASARKAERAAKSGAARSTEGKQALVEEHLPDEAQNYSEARASLSEMPPDEEKKILSDFCTTIEAWARKKRDTANATEKKRKREEEKEQLEEERRVKRKKAMEEKKQPSKQFCADGVTHVTGVDTGHCNPVYAARLAVNAGPDARPELYHVTLGQWYTETGQRNRTKVRNKKIKAATRRGDLPQLASLKTSNLAVLTQAMVDRLQHYDKYWAIHGSVAMRKLDFDVYIKKQKQLKKVFNALLPDETTKLAWGDGDFAHTRSGLPTAVGKTIERFIKTHRPSALVMTPEFRSSCLCANCHHYNKNLIHGFCMRRNGQLHLTGGSPSGRPIPRKIHGVLRCTHCHTRWNRDVNGALNIARIYLSLAFTGDVPRNFKRGFVIPEEEKSAEEP